MDEMNSNDKSIEIPLLAQVPGQEAPGPRADRMQEVFMVCFTAVNHSFDGRKEKNHPESDEQRITRFVGNWREFLVDLMMSLVLPVLLSIQFYMAYQFPSTTAETGLSHGQAQTNLALYTLACLSYRFSCGSSEGYDLHLYYMPEIVSDGIALLLLLHCTWLAFTLTSVFAMAFALAAVLNTCSEMMICSSTGLLDQPRRRRQPTKNADNNALDVNHHNRLVTPTLV